MSELDREKLIEYLYGEMSPAERPAFKTQIEENSELHNELLNFIQLREIVHEHLPEKKAPKKLTRKVLSEVGIGKSWFDEFFQTAWRPALAGAMVVAITLGISYQVKLWRSPMSTVADVKTEPIPVTNVAFRNSELKFSDLFLANQPLPSRLKAPRHSGFSGWGSKPSGLVSLASYGGTPSLDQGRSRIPGVEIRQLGDEAERAVAQFVHNQALKMRAMGDFKGAAVHLAFLIKTYPTYPLKLEALAQRVDCLFQAGDEELARNELAWLRTFSTDLAYLVERRWSL